MQISTFFHHYWCWSSIFLGSSEQLALFLLHFLPYFYIMWGRTICFGYVSPSSVLTSHSWETWTVLSDGQVNATFLWWIFENCSSKIENTNKMKLCPTLRHTHSSEHKTPKNSLDSKNCRCCCRPLSSPTAICSAWKPLLTYLLWVKELCRHVRVHSLATSPFPVPFAASNPRNL